MQHSFKVEVAKEFGIFEAVIIHNLFHIQIFYSFRLLLRPSRLTFCFTYIYIKSKKKVRFQGRTELLQNLILLGNICKM